MRKSITIQDVTRETKRKIQLPKKTHLEPFFAAQDSIPHVVASSRTALLRMLFAFHVEIQRYFGIDSDPEIGIHDALFVHHVAIIIMKKKGIR